MSEQQYGPTLGVRYRDWTSYRGVLVRDHVIPFFVCLIEDFLERRHAVSKGETRAKEQRDENASTVLVAQSESVQRGAWGSKNVITRLAWDQAK